MTRVQTPVLAGGVYAALVTPRKAGTPHADAAALLDYLDRVVQAGVDGLVLFGATGEFIHFDPAERARAATLAIRRSRLPVLVNISHSNLLGTVELGENAMRIGAAGVLLMPPYFYRYNEEDLFAFYQQVTDMLDGQISIYIYNLPAFTNPLSAQLICRILQLRGVVGIKDSSGDSQLLLQLADLRRSFDFRLLIGYERLFVEGRRNGADGTISGVSAALPEVVVALHRVLQRGHETQIEHFQVRLMQFMDWLEALPPVVAIRETAAFRGWVKSEPTLPLSPGSQKKVAELRAWLAVWLPAVIAECGTVRV